MKAIFSASLLALCLTGCQPYKKNVDNSEFYKAWQNGFKECMELAAKNGRAGDDDVSNLVDSCHSSSFQLNRYLDKD